MTLDHLDRVIEMGKEEYDTYVQVALAPNIISLIQLAMMVELLLILTCWVQANKLDEPFLNKSIKFYNELAIIFGDEVATGKFAKDDTQSLGVDKDAEDFDGGANFDFGTPSEGRRSMDQAQTMYVS